MAGGRKSIAGVLISLGVRGAGSGITLLTSVVLVRMLGGDLAGYVLLATTAVMMAAAIGRCGLEMVVLKAAAATPIDDAANEGPSAYRRSRLVAGAASLAIAVAVLLLAEPIALHVLRKPPMAACLRAIAPAMLLMPLAMIAARALQGYRAINSSLFVLNCNTNLLFLAMLVAVRPQTPERCCLLFAVATAVNYALGSLLLRSRRPTGRGELTWEALRTMAVPNWIGVVVETLVRLAGPLIAGAYCTPLEVTQMSVSQRLAMVVTIALTAATYHAAPELAAAYRQEDHAKLKRVTQRAARWSCLLAFPVLLPMLIVPGWVLSIYGADVAEGATLLRIMAAGQIINVMTGPVGNLLKLCDLERQMRNATIAAGAWAVFGGWLLTWQFGAIGAAVSTATAVSGLMLLAAQAASRHLGFHPIAVLLERPA